MLKFNNRFKEHRRDFIYVEGKLRFANHVTKEGHEMKTMQEIMTIVHNESNF